MTVYTPFELTRIQARVRPTYAVTREALESIADRQTIHDMIQKNLIELVRAEAFAHFNALVKPNHTRFESQWQMEQNLLVTRASWLPHGPLMYGDKVVGAGKWAHASPHFRDAPRSLAILENSDPTPPERFTEFTDKTPIQYTDVRRLNLTLHGWDDRKDAWIYQ